MSYILDALKKSEQERKKGSVPGLGTIQGLPGGRFEDNWPIRYYIAGTLVLLVATAAFVWVFLREPDPSQIKIAAPTPPPLSAAPVATLAPKGIPSEKPATRDESYQRATKPLPAKVAAPHRPRVLAPATSASHKAPASAPLLATPPIQPSEKVKTPMAEAIAPSLTENEPPPNDTPSEEAEVVIKPEEMPIIPLAELPEEIKSEMPEVKIGIHFFSDDKASRRAGVNGRLLHEGQQVDKDLILTEITKDGAILAFRGRRFTLAVFPR